MFELIESISIDTDSGTASGQARIPADHPMLADHFPGAPLLPGSWLVELGAQIAGPLAEEALYARQGIRRWTLLAMIREAKFPKPAPRPVSLRLTAKLERLEASSAVVSTQAFSEPDSQHHLRANLVLRLVEASPEWAEAIAARRQRVAAWKSAGR